MLCQRYFQRTPAFFAITLPGSETTVTGAYSMYVPMRANPVGTNTAGNSLHRPGVAFYSVTSIAGVQDAVGAGYTTLGIAAGAGALTSGQINGGLFLSAEL
jgi:hypothetical protein